MASRDHVNPFFYQGGTILAKKYLRMVVDEGDPMGGFHSFAAGVKKRIRIEEEDLNVRSNPTSCDRPCKKRKVIGIEAFSDVDKGKPNSLIKLGDQVNSNFTSHRIRRLA